MTRKYEVGSVWGQYSMDTNKNDRKVTVLANAKRFVVLEDEAGKIETLTPENADKFLAPWREKIVLDAWLYVHEQGILTNREYVNSALSADDVVAKLHVRYEDGDVTITKVESESVT